MTATTEEIRPALQLDGYQRFNYLAPTIDPQEATGQADVLFAAKWAVFEPIAIQLMEEAQTEQLDRASRIYRQWSERAAELNRPDDAKRDHSISIALAQKSELIRRFPGEMTDVAACLSDIFEEKTVQSWT